jgi:chromosomal replication initiation ATPase DnaA
VLGDSDFVRDVIAEAEEKAKETLRLRMKLSDLPSLAVKVCRGEGVDESDLRSGVRRRNVVKSRKIFSQIAVKKMGYSGADVARFLGITTSAVNRLAASDELTETEKYS